MGNYKGVLSSILFLGVVLAALPIAAGYFLSDGIGFMNFIWMIPGLFFITISIIGLVFASLYVRAKGNLAFVL